MSETWIPVFADLPNLTGGVILQKPVPNQEIRYLLTDSRKLIFPAETLYFAIEGKRQDGHSFIADLYSKGVRNFVVEKITDLEPFPAANFVLVPNAVWALQRLGASKRKKFTKNVIGITGSNGKTIIKEWLSALLAPDFYLAKSPQSYNSQIGVPLSVWQLKAEHDLGIFEAGISLPGEMQRLEEIIRPTIGIFTNIGTAHDEGFKNRHQKIAEKMKLFKHSSALIFFGNQPLAHEIPKLAPKGLELLPWFLLDTMDHKDGFIEIIIYFKGENGRYLLPFSGNASVENVGHCIALLLYLEVKPSVIQERILRLKDIPMRLEFKQGINGCYIIDDSYNNDLAGLNLALQHFQQKNGTVKQSKTLILLDMLENGGKGKGLYSEIALLIGQYHLGRFIGIGSEMVKNADLFPDNSLFFTDTEQFIAALPTIPFQNELVLVKGARVFGFERIVAQLQEKVHGTRLEINLGAITHNLNFYRSLLKPETKVMVMVKAFAYGSGLYEVANLLQYLRVDYLAVAYTDEGVALRREGITLPILVLNPAPDTFQQLYTYNLEPDLYNEVVLTAFANFLESVPEGGNKILKVHIEFNTGMNRLGFKAKEVHELGGLLQKYNHLWKVETVFSHLVASDDEQHYHFTLEQIESLKACVQALEKVLGYQPMRHILNSGGITRFPEAQMEMIRLGIGLYGIEVNNLYQDRLQLAAALKTSVSQINRVEAGETIGYGRKGKVEAESQIATIAIGYSDGFGRRLSNGIGKVKINGISVPVIGNVCMDMAMVNITGLNVSVGEEVVIFDDAESLNNLATELQTIPYEVLTSIGERVKRVFFQE